MYTNKVARLQNLKRVGLESGGVINSLYENKGASCNYSF
jgi:hypothetical protein